MQYNLQEFLQGYYCCQSQTPSPVIEDNVTVSDVPIFDNFISLSKCLLCHQHSTDKAGNGIEPLSPVLVSQSCYFCRDVV